MESEGNDIIETPEEAAPENETETEAASGAEPDPGTETESESNTVTETEPETETEAETGTELESGTETESEPDTGTETDSETEAETGTVLLSDGTAPSADGQLGHISFQLDTIIFLLLFVWAERKLKYIFKNFSARRHKE